MIKRIDSAGHKMNRESSKFQRGETEIQRKALAMVLKSSEKDAPDFKEKYTAALNAQMMTRKLQEKIGTECLVTPYQRRGYQKIAIDEPKEALKKKYGAQILKDTAENIQADKKRYEGKTEDEILDIYFSGPAIPQIVITATAEGKVFNVELHHYKHFFSRGHQMQLTGEQIENETENFAHFLKTGEMRTQDLKVGEKFEQAKKKNEMFNQPDFNPDDYTA
ncbi:MAG: hypothetical protein CO170_01630 [candidate division SR1 bacterium CG_4_9_14_3_um_filter_40_9]|nr:MAG: hypothetical protein CO170_01630 [candidate division SR1 bacterium CG_4_9_14_3_um_filter_40_9]